MGFLDNLEDSLKNLESREERDPAEQQRREERRTEALAVAPWAEKLKHSDFTKKLFNEAAAAGHRVRAKVYMSWMDNILRIEAKQRRMELQPTSEGIVARFSEPSGEERSEPLDLNGSDPRELIERWLG